MIRLKPSCPEIRAFAPNDRSRCDLTRILRLPIRSMRSWAGTFAHCCASPMAQKQNRLAEEAASCPHVLVSTRSGDDMTPHLHKTVCALLCALQETASSWILLVGHTIKPSPDHCAEQDCTACIHFECVIQIGRSYGWPPCQGRVHAAVEQQRVPRSSHIATHNCLFTGCGPGLSEFATSSSGYS